MNGDKLVINMLPQFHIAITFSACRDLLDKELADIIVHSNFMQDGYPLLSDYFPRVYRIVDTIYKQFFRHEYHYTRTLRQKNEKAIVNAENYIAYTWLKSIDKTISLGVRAKYLGMNLHARQDKFSHFIDGKVVSFTPLDFLGIGYCHLKYAIDSPDKNLLEKAFLDTKEVIENWTLHHMK